MPKLKTTLGKAEHDALDETLKALYIADGENFKLDADFEDVAGLKAKRDELLGKLTDQQKLLKQFDGLTPEAARAALAKLGEIEDGQLLKKQQFDELLTKRKGEWEKEREGLLNRLNSQTQKQAEQQLAIKLSQSGVKPELIEDLATVLTHRHIKFVEDGGDVVWKTKDGLESVNLDTYIPALKETKGNYFQSTAGAGSGATGSQSNGGSAAKTWNRSQWDAASTPERTAFSSSGGKLTD